MSLVAYFQHEMPVFQYTE